MAGIIPGVIASGVRPEGTPTGTIWGSSSFGNGLSVNEKLTLAQNLGCHVTRADISVKNINVNNPVDPTLDAIINHNNNSSFQMKASLNINWDNGPDKIFVNGETDLTTFTNNMTLVLNKYQNVIEFVIIENEVDNGNGFNQNEAQNPTSNYIEQVRRAILVAHSFNIKVGDSGLHVPTVQGGPNSRGGKIVAEYDGILAGLDYCNVHLYYPRDSNNDVTNVVDTFNANKTSAQLIISNESGIKNQVDPDTIIPQEATDLVNILAGHGFHYVVINAGIAASDTGIAKPFNDRINGVEQVTPNGNGDAFILAVAAL